MLSQLFSSTLEQTLFCAMYSLAFHALLRVGEYTVTDTSAHVIKFEALTFQIKRSKIVRCSIKLPHNKYSLEPTDLDISKSWVSCKQSSSIL